MKKRTAIVIGLVYLALLISSVFNVSAQSESIAPASIEAEQGDTFTINSQVDPEDDDIYGAQYVLYFDSSIMGVHNYTEKK